MRTRETSYTRNAIHHLLVTHGFRSETDKAWSKSSRSQDVIAELDENHSHLHLMIFDSPEDLLIFETNVDLNAADEPVLEKVISTYDLR